MDRWIGTAAIAIAGLSLSLSVASMRNVLKALRHPRSTTLVMRDEDGHIHTEEKAPQGVSGSRLTR